MRDAVRQGSKCGKHPKESWIAHNIPSLTTSVLIPQLGEMKPCGLFTRYAIGIAQLENLQVPYHSTLQGILDDDSAGLELQRLHILQEAREKQLAMV